VRVLALLMLLLLNLPSSGGLQIAETRLKAGIKNPNECVDVRFEGSSFTHCVADPEKHRIEVHVTGKNGVLFRGFPALASETEISDVAFGMNGGMYDARSRPIGYYVEGGEKLYPLNRDTGAGNFYRRPNGVFFGTDGRWQVLPTENFDGSVNARPEFGTQSGPMLLINGAFHPDIAPNGASKYIRNAVGLDVAGRAHFVISNEPVSFGQMARMMRDLAKTSDALYLDGEVSALWNPATSRMDGRYPLGPLILVKRKRDETKP
jgi:uncharacterized protein YigE (DUF2233 family)